jgi:DNA-binding NarL/FixJ family response regulator
MGGTILIVDDHEITRRAIRVLLSEQAPAWTVCGEAANGLDAIEQARALEPDVILMDISMPEMDGLSATEIIKKEFPETCIVIVSQNDPGVASEQAKKVGASEYVQKSALSETLVSSLQRLFDSAKDFLPSDGGCQL